MCAVMVVVVVGVVTRLCFIPSVVGRLESLSTLLLLLPRLSVSVASLEIVASSAPRPIPPVREAR